MGGQHDQPLPGQLQLLERHAPFIRAAEGVPAGRVTHPVYAFYRIHVVMLLRQILGETTESITLPASLVVRRSSGA